MRANWGRECLQHRTVDVARLLQVGFFCAAATIASCLGNAMSIADSIIVGAVGILANISAAPTATATFNLMTAVQDVAQIDTAPGETCWLRVVHEIVGGGYAIAVASVFLVSHLPLGLFLVLPCFLPCVKS